MSGTLSFANLLGMTFDDNTHIALVGAVDTSTGLNFNIPPGTSISIDTTNSFVSANDIYNPGTGIISISFMPIPAGTVDGLGNPVNTNSTNEYFYVEEARADGTNVEILSHYLLGDNNYAIVNTTAGAIFPGNPPNIVGFPSSGNDLVFSVSQDLNTADGSAPSTIVISGSGTCFARGSRLTTASGLVAVETIRAGDTLRTAAGHVRPVVWAGRTLVDLARHPAPDAAAPIRVLAGAFGGGLPTVDLVLSPDHAVFTDGVLVPIKHLENGRTIRREHLSSIEYFHVELESHDVILAEGLAVESYLDTDGHASFEGSKVRVLHPTFTERAREAGLCAEMVIDGPVLDGLRARLNVIADSAEQPVAPLVFARAS